MPETNAGGECRIAGAALLEDGASRTFALHWAGREREGFVLAHDGKHRAFLNECPHWGVELDLGDGHFFDRELGRIYCKNHGALFSPIDGVCETGPCLGRALTQLRVRREADDLVVEFREVGS